jgi:Zn-dependent metalloprotease
MSECFIIPRPVLEKLRDQARSAGDQRAIQATLELTTRLRGERSFALRHLLPRLLAAAPAPPAALERRVFDARRRTHLPGTLVRKEGEEAGTDPAVNQAYDSVGLAHRFYREVFDRVSVDGRGMRLDSTVHYGRQFDNAFWNGVQMVYGDGKVFHGFTEALDVIVHELTHGVTQYAVPDGGLIYHDQPGALNESMSDVFGVMGKQWHLDQTVDQADWLIGADIFPPGSGQTLRSMKDPASGYVPQPSRFSDYVNLPDDEFNDNGGVHINSGIPNHAFYLAAMALGGRSWVKAGQIWYRALGRLSPTADFKSAANATLEAAAERYGQASPEVKAVTDAWRAVEIFV